MLKYGAAASIVFTTVVPRLSVFGLGAGLLLTLVAGLRMLNGSALGYDLRPSVGYGVFVRMYLVFAVAVALPMLALPSRDLADLRYTVSVVAVVTVLAAVPSTSSALDRRIQEGIHLGVTIAACFLLARWVYLAALAGDIFVLRHAESGFSGAFSSNPNLTARIAIVLLAAAQFGSDVGVTRSTGTLVDSLRVRLPQLLSLLIVATLSRANIIALVVFWVVRSALSDGGRRPVRLIGVGAMIVVGLVFGGETLISRLSETTTVEISEDSTLRGRSWAASLGIIEDHPLTGVGLSGEYGEMRDRGSYAESVDRVIVTHGGFLKIAVYAGLPAAIAMIAVLGTALRLLTRRSHGADGRATRSSAAATGAAFVVALIPMNLGADGLGLALVWFVLGYVVATHLNLVAEAKSVDRIRRPDEIEIALSA